jgi:ornithine cyclodeaminase/alanine dehydrogenase-like protein (mu-crystallin family)
MIRYLKEKDVAQLLPMANAVELVEESLKARAEGRASDVPRVRARMPAGTLHMMEATAGDLNVIGYKAYFSATGKGTRFYVHLFDTESGKPTAIIEASHLGMVRTGAASGIATKYMSNPEAQTLGVLGSGRQARTQVEAICAVRPIKSVKVYSPTPANREKFCADIAAAFKVEANAVGEPEQAVRDSEIIVSATTAEQPVVCGRWLRPGAHINAIGANS